MSQLEQGAGATEESEACDMMAWIGLMNICEAQAAKIVLTELINSRP